MTDKKSLYSSVRKLKPTERAEIDRILDAAMKGEAIVVFFATEPPDEGVVAANADLPAVLDIVDVCLADIRDGNYYEDGKDTDDTKH